MSENFAPAAQFYSHLVSNKNFEYEENITKKNGYFKKIMVTSTKLKKITGWGKGLSSTLELMFLNVSAG